MELTEKNQSHIDNLSYEDLLRRWRNAPAGDPWFEGNTGEYWVLRMGKLRDTVDHAAISKKVGWDG